MKELKTREEVEAIQALESEVIEAAVAYRNAYEAGDRDVERMRAETSAHEELLEAVEHLLAARE